MSADRKRIKGLVTLTLADIKTGRQKRVQRHNLVVTNGEQWIARRLLGTLTGGSQTAMKWIELGLRSLAATASQTQLALTASGVTGIRKIYTTQSVSGATWSIIVNFTAGEANTLGLKEAGIFGTSTAYSTAVPGMLARTVFTAVNKTSADTLKIQWQINFADDGV